MGIITFNGVPSSEYGIVVEHFPDYEYPERDYTVTHVPGRNGDIVVDSGSYQNVERTYQIAIGAIKEPFEVAASKISKWLHEPLTYARLEDSYEPEVYRLAYYNESGKVENIFRMGGRIEITFSCKPQRYLKTGEKMELFDSSTNYIYNPTGFNAKPVITVYGTGTGTITINGKTFTLTGMTEGQGFVIDSTIEDAYDKETRSINLNSKLTCVDFPELEPGDNTIELPSAVDHIEIVPNWWTL